MDNSSDAVTNDTICSVYIVIFTVPPALFCILAVFVLVYYIRRRYRLYQEIKRVTKDSLVLQSYQNYLKNLKIKSSINNFIIIVLLIELAENLSFVISIIYIFGMALDGKNNTHLFSYRLYLLFYYLFLVTNISLVPVLSLIMKFLWLVYRKYKYKHTLIRWTWYITIRALGVSVLYFICEQELFPADYKVILDMFSAFLTGCIYIYDFRQFVCYSRKFYLHLKSKEKEIRLFYYDHKAYLDIKYLRIHFKVATILVVIALFFNTLGIVFSAFTGIFGDMLGFLPILLIPDASMSAIAFLLLSFLCFYLSKILIYLNYLYLVFVIVYKSIRDRQKLANINSYIKPLVKKYHETIYTR